MFVSTLAPRRPASTNVSTLPAEAIQIGGRDWMGRGSTLTSIILPAPFGTEIDSPRHSLSTVSIDSFITSRRRSKLPGINAKSFACQPEANERPTRPPDNWSSTAQSSATRRGLCRGNTMLPARSCTREVMVESAAVVTAGFG